MKININSKKIKQVLNANNITFNKGRDKQGKPPKVKIKFAFSQDFKNTIREKVGNNDLEECIELMLEDAKRRNLDPYGIIMVRQRLNSLKSQVISGGLKNEDINSEKSLIASSILLLIT